MNIAFKKGVERGLGLRQEAALGSEPSADGRPSSTTVIDRRLSL